MKKGLPYRNIFDIYFPMGLLYLKRTIIFIFIHNTVIRIRQERDKTEDIYQYIWLKQCSGVVIINTL